MSLLEVQREGFCFNGSRKIAISYKRITVSDFWVELKLNFIEKNISTIVIFEKKKFQIMCHMIGLYH